MLKLTRTANAGVLLEIDGKRILLDGVCREVSPYPATPDHVRRELCLSYPDMVAVTHRHEDHCDPFYEGKYTVTTGRPVIDPIQAGKRFICGNVSLAVIPSRHLGRTDCPHCSFIVEGSSCVWFMGDASPEQWKNRPELKKPDVLIAPYAYASTEHAWRITQSLGAKKIVLLHLPQRDKDMYDLWSAVCGTVGENRDVFIPKMEEFVEISF